MEEKKLSQAQSVMVVFVSDEGDVFFRGIEQPELKNTLKPTSQLTKEEKDQRKAEFKKAVKESDTKATPPIPGVEMGEITENSVNTLKESNPEIEALKLQVENLSKLVLAQQELAKQGGSTQVIKVKDEIKFGEPLTRDMTPDDLADEPVSFFTADRGGPKSVYYLEDNIPCYAPYNKPLLFVYQNTDRKKIGRETEITHISKYTTQSKKEIVWLEGHPEYNHTMFRDVHEVVKVNQVAANKMANISMHINAMEKGQLYAEAKRYGVFDTTKSYSEIKASLLIIKYDEAVQESARLADRRIKEMSVGLTTSGD